MKRLRLGAICAGIAAGLAVSYSVLAHDFSALKDGSGNAVRSSFGDCVETSGVVGAGTCLKGVAAAAAPAAMADKKEMMADKKDAMPAAAAGAAAATTAATTTAAKTAGANSLANVKDGSGQTVRAAGGGCVESTAGSSGGCDAAATTTAAAPAAMADKKDMGDKKAMPAGAVAAAGAGAALGNHQIGEATHGHLADGQRTPVRTGFGGCVNLGFSVNSPDHAADCAFQAPAKTAAAAPAAEKPKADAKPVPAAPAKAVPGTVASTAATGDAAAMAKAVPAAPPVSVPGTVRNTNPIGAADSPAAMAMADDSGANDGGLPARPPRARRAPGALVDDSAPQEMAAAPASDSELKPSPMPQAIPMPPTAPRERADDNMAVPPSASPQSSGPVAAAPSAPPTAVPGTVRNTAPQGDSAAPQGDVQMPKAKPGTVPAPAYEKISLSADVLFKFDKYREKDILPGGREKLDDVADKINSYVKDTLEGITLTGHTDRLGSDAYNQRLSERRAKTVKNYLVKKGVDAGKISNSGRGEREPVVQCKGNKATKKLIACLQPNRRVDVEIRGVKQK